MSATIFTTSSSTRASTSCSRSSGPAEPRGSPGGRADQPFSPSQVFMKEDPDAALVLASRAGDRRAFEQLLARYERPVFNAAFRILHHREDAADVTQTAFLRAYEHLDQYDPAQRFFSWLYRIAINEAMDVGGRRKPDPLLLEAIADPGQGPDASAAGDQSDASLQRALMALGVD